LHIYYISATEELLLLIVVQGISNAYEVAAVTTGERSTTHNLAMKTLPCPCQYCYSGDEAYAPCPNVAIVGEVTYDLMEEIVASECPAVLFEPITNYTIEVLKLFIRSHEKRLKGSQTKPMLVYFIRNELNDHVIVKENLSFDYTTLIMTTTINYDVVLCVNS
jgi:hypothetical protein